MVQASTVRLVMARGEKVKNKAQRVETRVDQKNLEHEMEKAPKPIRMLDAAAAASVRPAAHGFGPFRVETNGMAQNRGPPA